MAVKRLIDFLEEHHVKYVQISHSRAYTAQEIAHAAHVAGKNLAKSIVVLIDRKPAMVVISANSKVDVERMREITGADRVELATEQKFRDLFPECETGAMPPFGNLFGMDVFVDSELADDSEIFFNAGTHTELIRLSYSDFERLVEPKVVTCGIHMG